MVQSNRRSDKECGSSDDHLPALTLAVIIYFKGIGHDIIYFPLFVSVSLPNQSIDRMIKKQGFISQFLSDRTGCMKDIIVV